MEHCDYYAPRNLDEVLELLEQFGEDAKLIAGGQSLMILINQRAFLPQVLVSLKGVTGIDAISWDDGCMSIGALATHRSLELDLLIKKKCPSIPAMEKKVGSLHVRNWGTLGGSLAHGDPGSDPATLLISLEAQVTLQSKRGSRTVPLASLYKGFLQTGIASDEILTRISVPVLPRASAYFAKESVRAGDMAIASCGVQVQTGDQGVVSSACIAIGGVGPVPFVAVKAARLLTDGKPEREIFAAAAAAAAEEAEVLPDSYFSEAYKRRLIQVLVKNALETACQGNGGMEDQANG